MTNTQTKAFQSILETRLIELGNGRWNRESLAVEASPDELDRIQNANDRDYAMSNLAREAKRLQEVQIALRRIQEGSFGSCVVCEEDINPKRLAAIPWASSCIACQESAEQENSAPSGEETETTPAMAASNDA